MRPTRRTVLTAGVLLGAAACTDSPAPRRPRPVDPDVALRGAAVARERALLAAYDAALGASPGLAARLGPVREEHAAHLAALGGEQQAATVVPSGAPAAPPPAPSVGALAQAEREAAAAHAAATTTASPGLAALLAQLAASESSHPVALA